MTKIMLVEDDKSLREIYGVRLLAEGYDIISAGDGEEALAIAVKEHPDLILSDVMMPKISGFDMLDILRATPETREIKVIMMTALSSEDQRSRGESLGANRYLVKSQVGIEDVVRTVHDVLADSPVIAQPASQVFGQQVPTISINTNPNATSSTPATQPTITTSPSNPVQSQPMPQPIAPFSTSAPASLGNQNMPSTSEAPTMQPSPIPVNTNTRPMTITPITRPTPQPAPQEARSPQPNNPFTSFDTIQPAQPTPAPQQTTFSAQPTASNDIAAMMEQELSSMITPQPPQNPTQSGPIDPTQL